VSWGEELSLEKETEPVRFGDPIKKNRRWLTSFWVLLILVSAVPTGLWLGSGCEVLTKSSKAVEIEVISELFGDTIHEIQLARGPIFGYFVGLDVVALVSSLFLAVVGMTAIVRRIRRQSGVGFAKEQL